MDNFPSVSIVIVNLNGKHHLHDCFQSIQRLNYPKDKIEVILVDNGSTDGSVEYVSKKFSWVKLICNSKNEGFAKPSNDGARAAKGEYVAFLNNDMRVQRNWLIELIKSLRENNAQCAGSVILNWNGKLLDFAGGGINFQGFGFQHDFQRPMSEMGPKLTKDRELFFACGGAMIVERKMFLFAGGFDEDYFAYYEDVDLGWRLRVLGCKIVLSVKSRVYHKHNSTSNTLPRERIQYLFERNKLYTCYKNYGDELFYKVFFPSLLLEIREIYLGSKIDGFNYNIKNPMPFEKEPVKIGHYSAMKLSALNEFIQNIRKVDKKRAFIQANRKVPDEEIIKLMGDPFLVFPKDTAGFLSSEYEIIKTFGIDKLLKKDYKCKILLISNDTIGEKMAGTGIRYWEIAKALSKNENFEVSLGCPNECDIEHDGINIVTYSQQEPERLLQAAKEATIVMFMGFVLEAIPDLRPIVDKKYVIIDIYDPFVIEGLEVFRNEDYYTKNLRHREASASLEYQLKLGDFFVCANEKQKDYWLGMLSQLGRVNPELYAADRSCNKLIDIVPFGIPDEPPKHTKNVLKGVWPGINKDDKVLIWGGGVWNWFDPLTLIKAVSLISKERSDIKLFFMGVKHPNPAVDQMEMLNKAVELAHKLDVYDKYVFFNFNWVDYNDRQNYLLEADIGVSNHFNTLETRFSFRTRILDYLWANLPIICTEGDHFAELVEEERLGAVVPYEDEEALARAIIDLIDNKEKYNKSKENAARIAEKFKWSRVTEPIVSFCREPVHYSSREGLYAKAHEYEEEPRAIERPVRKGSVQDKLNIIESQQREIMRMLRTDSRRIKEIHDNTDEIKDWTYLMNERFIKLKTKIGRFRLLRRFIK